VELWKCNVDSATNGHTGGNFDGYSNGNFDGHADGYSNGNFDGHADGYSHPDRYSYPDGYANAVVTDLSKRGVTDYELAPIFDAKTSLYY